MMHLRRIIVKDFKNILSADIAFSSKINCICGDNGEGKTNLLDAVYYLSMTKSFLSSNDRYTYNYAADEAVLHGDYMDGDTALDIAVAVRRDGSKTVRRNGKSCRRISEHIGTVPVVMTAPSDTSLIHDPGEERRRFLNMMISQMDREYLQAVISYNRLLKQRNSLLKQEVVQDLLLDTVTERMYGFSEYIYRARAEAVERLAAEASTYYNMISGGKESVSIGYRSDLSRGVQARDVFAASSRKDRIMGYTTAGVQRDDLELTMDGYPIRRCSSQGQQKSFLIALKMAQYAVMRGVSPVRPILLFDDLFDKLDAGRVASLIKMVVEGDFGQIFITDTDEERLRGIVGDITDQGRFYNVKGGVVTERGV